MTVFIMMCMQRELSLVHVHNCVRGKEKKRNIQKKKEKKNKYIYKERNKTTNTQKQIIKNQTKQLL